MRIILIVLGYLKWHYGLAIISLSQIWQNFTNFIYHFFSINLLFKNFFDPWKKMSDSYPTSFDLKKYFYAFMTNIIVRIVGMIMRSGLLIIGLTTCLLFILTFPIIMVTWLLLPLIILFLFGNGLILIIT